MRVFFIILILFTLMSSEAFAQQAKDQKIQAQIMEMKFEQRKQHVEQMAEIKYKGDVAMFLAENNDCLCDQYLPGTTNLGNAVWKDIKSPTLEDIFIKQCLGISNILAFMDKNTRYKIYKKHYDGIKIRSFDAWETIKGNRSFLRAAETGAIRGGVDPKRVQELGDEIESLQSLLRPRN